jgi:hypothetical protein
MGLINKSLKQQNTLLKRLKNDTDKNWLYAIGAYRTITKANIKTYNGQIFMNVNYIMKDVYDFHRYKCGQLLDINPQVPIPLTNAEITVVHAYDYEFENLHRYGMAKEFTVVGIQNYTANFNIGFQPANKDQMVDIFLPYN